MRNVSIFLQEIGRRITKRIFTVRVEIGNHIFICINIKRVFFDSLIKSTVYLLIFHQNSMIFEGGPNSLTESYFTGEYGLVES